MDQVEARRLARMLSETTGTIHIATTQTALHGQWPAVEEVWVILPAGVYPWTRAITSAERAIAKINRTG